MGFCDGEKKPRKKRKPRTQGRRIVAPRTRMKTDIIPGVFTMTHVKMANNPRVDTYDVKTGTHSELLVDVIGLQQCWMNPCWHEKMSLEDGKIPSVVLSGIGTVLESNGIPVSPLDLIRSIVPGPPASKLDDLNAMSTSHFITAVDSSHSLINFIIELIQVVSKIITDLQKCLSIWQNAMRMFWTAYNKARGDGLSEAASYWLAWNFAIKPTLNDLKAILCGIAMAQKRMEWLAKMNGKPTYVKFSVKDCWKPTVMPETGMFFFNEFQVGQGAVAECSASVKLKCVEYKLDYNSTGLVRFNIPSYLLEGWPGVGTVWATMSGLYNPLAIWWEATPFSWLIDWFVSYRTKMQLQMTNFTPIKDGVLIDSGHSFKLTSTWVMEFSRDDTAFYSIGKIKYSTYSRQPGLPPQDWNPLRVPFEWYNASILLALARQWWARRR